MGGSMASFRFLLYPRCVTNPLSALRAMTETDPTAGRQARYHAVRTEVRQGVITAFSRTSHLGGRAWVAAIS